MTMVEAENKTVFLTLAQYSHYSDLLRGDFVKGLAEKFRVVVLTPLIDAELARRDLYPQSRNIEYVKLPLYREKLWMIFDKYLRVPLARELDHLTYMRYFYRRPHWWVRKLLMRLRVLLPKSFITLDRLTRWEVSLAKPSEDFTDLVEKYRPVIVITATPGFTPFEAEMIIFAKRLGIATMAVDINYDNLTSTGKMMRKADYLALWNELMKDEAQRLHHFADKQIAVVGCMRFDHYFTDGDQARFPTRELFLKSKGLDPAKKILVYAGPTPSNYPPRQEFMAELMRLKTSGRINGDPSILVRIHPNDRLDLYAEWMNLPGVCIERAGRQTKPDSAGGQKIEMDENDKVNLTATLKYADVVLNFASTVIMEACIFDRPVINIAFPDYRRIVYQYEYNKYLVDTGAVRLANSPEELAAVINMYLSKPDTDRENRAKLLDEFIPFRDGKTWERTVEFISKIAESR